MVRQKQRIALAMLKLGCFTAHSVASITSVDVTEVKLFADELEKEKILTSAKLSSGESQYTFETGGWDKLHARYPENKDAIFL